MGLVRMYARHIDQIQAEETLQLISATQAGTANMRKEARNSYIRRLEKARDSNKARRPASAARLAASGIPFEVVKK